MKVLVTGGAGFIGHHISLHLAHRGFEVTVLDTLERANPVGLKKLREAGVSVITGDVRYFENYGSYDAVVHAAAYVSVEESMMKPVEYIDVNAIGTARVGAECSKRGIGVIYLSSAAVYGDPVKLPVGEDHPKNPLSPYGLSKLMGEHVLAHFAKVYGLRYISLRLFNVYGPGQNPSYAGVITRFIENALVERPLVIYGDGQQTRDFIYVGDVSRLIAELLGRELFINDSVNIGTGKATRIIDLAKQIVSLTGSRSEIIFNEPRRGDIRHSVADISKLRSLLNPDFTPLEEGLRKLLSEWASYKQIPEDKTCRV